MKNYIKTNFFDSWILTKRSFKFLSENMDLNIFPLVLIAILTLIVFSFHHFFPSEELILNNIYKFATALFLAYLFFSCAQTYIKTILMTIVLKRLNNEAMSLSQGFYSTNQHAWAILKWSIFTATLGWLLKLLENMANITRKIFGLSISFSWRIAAYFVLPIMIHDKISPTEATFRSLFAVGKGYRNTVSIKELVSIFFIFIFFIISEFITAYPDATLNFLISFLPLFLIAYFVTETLESILVSALFLNIIRLGSPKNFDPIMLARAFEKDE